jgi:hypothetical protein
MNIKSTSLPIQAFLAVLVATIFLPISASVSCIALTIAGVLAMLAADYGRELAPLRVPAPVIAFEHSGRAAEKLDVAA